MINFYYKVLGRTSKSSFRKQTLTDVLYYFFIKSVKKRVFKPISDKNETKHKIINKHIEIPTDSNEESKNLLSKSKIVYTYNTTSFDDYKTIYFKDEIMEIRKKRLNAIKEKYLILIRKKLILFNYKNILDFRNSQDFVQRLFVFLSKHIGTYKASIQELVEGQREVIHNDNFKFDDGETAKEKTDRFESKFKENFSTREILSKLKK